MELFVSVVIGRSSCFGFGLRQSSENRSNDKNDDDDNNNLQFNRDEVSLPSKFLLYKVQVLPSKSNIRHIRSKCVKCLQLKR